MHGNFWQWRLEISPIFSGPVEPLYPTPTVRSHSPIVVNVNVLGRDTIQCASLEPTGVVVKILSMGDVSVFGCRRGLRQVHDTFVHVELVVDYGCHHKGQQWKI